jgi:hypothetical protein
MPDVKIASDDELTGRAAYHCANRLRSTAPGEA